MAQSGPTEQSRSTGTVCVLVLGMHRSGSSAITRFFNALGCDVPKSLMLGNAGNPKGYFESSKIMDLNEQILSSAGSAWDDWRPFNTKWYASPVYPGFVRRARGVVRSEFPESDLFVIKDPRNCRIAQFWYQVLEGAQIAPATIITLRNPEEVARSLSERDGRSVSEGLLLWLRHVLDAEAQSRGRRRLFVSYNAIFQDWRGIARRAEEAFGFSWPKIRSATSEDMREFVDNSLRHHDLDDEGLYQNEEIPNSIKSIFAILTSWERDPSRIDSVADVEVIDGIRKQFDDYIDIYGDAFVSQKKQFSSEVKELRNVVSLLREERQRDEELSRELDATRIELGSLRDRNGVLEAAVAEASAVQQFALETLRMENSAAQADLAKRTQDAEALRGEVDRLQTLLQSLEAAIIDREHVAEVARTELATVIQSHAVELAQEAAKREAELKALRLQFANDAEAQSSTTAKLEERLAVEASGREALEREAAWLKQENQILASQVKTLEAELISKRQGIRKTELDLFEAVERNNRLEGDLARIESSMRQRYAEVDDMTKEIDRLVEERDAMEARLEDLKSQVEFSVANLRLVEGQLTTSSVEAARSRKLLAEFATFLGANSFGLKALLPLFLAEQIFRWRLRAAGLFDDLKYRRANPDVQKSKMDPLVHYVRHGLYEGRDPD